MKNILLLLFAASVLSEGVWSAELKSLTIYRSNDRYILDIGASLAVPVESARRIVSNYDNLTSINPFLKKSEVLKIDDQKRVTVHLITAVCVWRICYNVTHVQVFEWKGKNDLYSEIVPESSDFTAGWMRWTLRSFGNCTQVVHHAEVVPAFIVPPLVGPYLIKQKLVEIATETMKGVENKIAAETGRSAHESKCVPVATRD